MERAIEVTKFKTTSSLLCGELFGQTLPFQQCSTVKTRVKIPSASSNDGVFFQNLTAEISLSH